MMIKREFIPWILRGRVTFDLIKCNYEKVYMYLSMRKMIKIISFAKIYRQYLQVRNGMEQSFSVSKLLFLFSIDNG